MSSNSSNEDTKFNPELEDFEVDINIALSNLKHPSINDPIVNTNDLALSYFNYKNKGTDILPACVRAISSDYTWVMVERPPQEIKICYTNNYHDEGEDWEYKYYNVALPWTLYIMSFSDANYTHLDSMYMYAKKGVTQTEDEILYVLPWPNTFRNGETCCVDVISDVLEGSSLQAATNCIINTFWDSHFNCDGESASYHWTPEEFKGEHEKEDYDGHYQDAKNMLFLDFMSELSIEEVLDLHMFQAVLPDMLLKYDDDGECLTPRDIATVGQWIEYIEARSAKDPFTNMPNPFLSFMKTLI